MTSNAGEIYKAIPKIMGQIGPIAKTRKNSQQNYSFRGIDDLYNAIQQPMQSAGVFVAPEVVSTQREERTTKSGTNLFYTILTVRFRFFAGDGSSIEVVTVGEAMDSGDKSSNKAMSAAMKYALLQVFCIPTEEDNDTENSDHETMPRPQAKAPATQAKAPAPKERIVTEAQLKRLWAIKNAANWSDEKYRARLAEMGVGSSKDLSYPQYEAICKEMERGTGKQGVSR